MRITTTTLLSLLLAVASSITTYAYSTLLDLPFHHQQLQVHVDQVATWRARAAAYKAAQFLSTTTTTSSSSSGAQSTPRDDSQVAAAWRQHAASYKAAHFPLPSSVPPSASPTIAPEPNRQDDDDGVAAWRAHAQSYAQAQASINHDPDAMAWRAHASSFSKEAHQALPTENVQGKQETREGESGTEQPFVSTTPEDHEDHPEIVHVSQSEGRAVES